MLLSPQQENLIYDLELSAQVATCGNFSNLPFASRSSTLLVGPSGTGKSHLARELARKMDLPCLVINSASWMVCGSRAESWTVSLIAEWLLGCSFGGILVIDEIDKIAGDSEWTKIVRLEIHDVLDGIIPIAAKLPDSREPIAMIGADPVFGPVDRGNLCKLLKERIFILGCGAWQRAWTKTSNVIGFSKSQVETVDPTEKEIMGMIDEELRLRFRPKLSILRPMTERDYWRVAEWTEAQLPWFYRRDWRFLVGPAIAAAVQGNLGMRAFEEVTLEMLRRGIDGVEPGEAPFKVADKVMEP